MISGGENMQPSPILHIFLSYPPTYQYPLASVIPGYTARIHWFGALEQLRSMNPVFVNIFSINSGRCCMPNVILAFVDASYLSRGYVYV